MKQPNVDYSDMAFIFGLLFIAGGLFFIYAPLTLIAIGVSLVAIGILGAR